MDMAKMPPRSPSKITSLKCGLKTMPFIIANESFEKVASYGMITNMILYLKSEYHMDNATGAHVLFLWLAVSNFTPVLGAFISDSYLGRFRVIALASIASLFGTIVLWLTAILPDATPEQGKSASSSQLAMLISAFALLSIGAGGIRPCSLAFGADQFDKEENPKNESVLQTFFNFYYASIGVSIMLSVTLIVYIQDKYGYGVGYGIPAILMLLCAVMFLVGSPYYIKVKPNKSLFTGFVQVVVVYFKNRHLSLPPRDVDGGWYHHLKGSTLVLPTEKLRFLNKACVIRNPEKDLNPDETAADPWSLCTVQQVEELKSVLKVIPIWSSGIMIAVTISQHAFPVIQATTMNRHLTSSFQIPAGSFSVFGILTLTIWVAIYDRVLVPILARYTGNPRGIGLRQRMGIGLLLSAAAMATSAIVESHRRRIAIRMGFVRDPRGIVDMTAMWLIPQHCLTGLAEAFNAIGQIEFYYSQIPKSMSSIGVALVALGMGVGNLVGSFIVETVEVVTPRKGGKSSWVAKNINKGHYDYYYWLLCILSLVNFLYFLLCSWAYGDSKEKVKVYDYEAREDLQDIDVSKSRELAVLSI